MTTKLLRVNEVLDRLAISRSTLYELTKAGRLPVVRLGRATRFPAEAVAELMKPAS